MTPSSGVDGPSTPPAYGLPLRVSTLELFFDLVFVFTITQLTGLLARDLTLASAGRVLLVFGVLWWMYGGYAWLTNARTPVSAQERLLLLLGMAGFLVIGLSIPGAFGTPYRHASDGVALGLGYLLVIVVHAGLYQRVNRNIQLLLPFNITSAVLIIIAGVASGPAAYLLWAAALAIQALSPLLVKVGGRFEIRPAHFVERHGALIIVVFGESVADIGAGVGDQRVTPALALSAVLGLALAAALWWIFFGTGEDERAEEALTSADPADRPRLALAGYFYAYIPMLLGIVGLAAGIKRAIGHPAATLTASSACALAVGTALFLGGDVLFRHVLSLGTLRYRAAGAALALAAWPAAMTLPAAAAIALLLAIVAATLLAPT